jgi:hypothetical protein
LKAIEGNIVVNPEDKIKEMAAKYERKDAATIIFSPKELLAIRTLIQNQIGASDDIESRAFLKVEEAYLELKTKRPDLF